MAAYINTQSTTPIAGRSLQFVKESIAAHNRTWNDCLALNEKQQRLGQAAVLNSNLYNAVVTGGQGSGLSTIKALAVAAFSKAWRASGGNLQPRTGLYGQFYLQRGKDSLVFNQNKSYFEQPDLGRVYFVPRPMLGQPVRMRITLKRGNMLDLEIRTDNGPRPRTSRRILKRSLTAATTPKKLANKPKQAPPSSASRFLLAEAIVLNGETLYRVVEGKTKKKA
jgi:hypothetical protein